MNELELVERAKNGDTKAFEELVNQTKDKIYNLGLRILGNKEDAADLLQETYIKAYESLPKFEGRSSFSTWLYRIATNFALMKLRKEKYKKISIDELKEKTDGTYKMDISDWTSNPYFYYKNEELKEVLNEAINSLPPKYKTVFILHDIEGLSIQEISEILSLSIPTTKTRIHRSRLYLREKLSEYFKKKEN
ncbi:MAG: sigma-70 family RNA polymerase sigma factor [Candidatus Omnitrophica bacterium]|nr:sigma-70 family RNA polymerase sigma factor [Candidatus Omnitrophota bacterium]MCM8807340.1 sigma-70 family RNA polymerase sigma factor [Candidatus Omnitrophota bacterium]